MKKVWVACSVIVAYGVVSSLLHFAWFPERTPPAEDRPRSGTEVDLPGGSKLRFLVTGIESDGEVMRAEWVGQPDSGIGPHTHPSQTVRFQITSGGIQVSSDGAETWLKAGEEVVIPAGVRHSWENSEASESRGVFEIRPAGMSDFVFEQLDRAFSGNARPAMTALQTLILIGTHGKHTAWPIRTIRFLTAPTARLFGVRSYYPPNDASPRAG